MPIGYFEVRFVCDVLASMLSHAVARWVSSKRRTSGGPRGKAHQAHDKKHTDKQNTEQKTPRSRDAKRMDSKIWVGVDPGEKRIGVARCDALGLSARPRGIVGTIDELAKQLMTWHEEEPMRGVVVGLPRNMDGSYGPMAQRSLEFAQKLREKIPLTVVLWDERLTSQQVIRQQAERGGKKADVIDDQAAAILLQSYLEAGTPPAPDPEMS